MSVTQVDFPGQTHALTYTGGEELGCSRWSFTRITAALFVLASGSVQGFGTSDFPQLPSFELPLHRSRLALLKGLVLRCHGTWGDDLGLSENAVIMLDKAIQVRDTLARAPGFNVHRSARNAEEGASG